MFIKKSLIALGCFSLVACGGSDSGRGEVNKPAQSVPELNPMQVPLTALSSAPSSAFERHLKNGIYLRNQTDIRMTLDGAPEASSSAAAAFSTTNVQEQGVDEGDRIKYDGQYLFIANQQPMIGIMEGDSNNAATSIRIMQKQAQGAMQELTTVTVNEEASHINGLYLRDDTLAVLSDIYHYNIAAMTFAEGFFPTEQKFNLSLVDTSVKQAPSIDLTYTIDGAIIDSRRIDNVLYIVSSYRPMLDDVVYATTEQQQLDNYNTIMQTDISELLPQYSDGQGNSFSLVDAQDCYLPESATELDGFDGVVTLTAINLAQPTEMHSICVNAQVQGLYASQQSLYLYGTEYQYLENKSSETSIIHKFELAQTNIAYRASGTLDGRFNWNLSNLRFSEQGDYLRVVTTTGDSMSGFNHSLNVLAEDGNRLTVVSQLPNDINVLPIGKVSDDGKVYEDIQAVRFFKDQAYIVTFLKSDPLYVINLADNLNPVIAGALEIPGYSAYLHPISEHLLLGVGQNVDPGQVPNGGDETTDDTDDSSPIEEGAKVTLFNIADMSSPQEINSIVYPDAYTPVEFDYHALSALTMADGSTRIALPIERWLTQTLVDEQTQQKYDVWSNENELAVLEVSSQQGDAQLTELGRIKAEYQDDKQVYASGWEDRSIIEQDNIYYIHGHQVWHGLWSDITNVTGPY